MPGGLWYSPARFHGDLVMASDNQHYEHGQMDISSHTRAWAGFVAFVKWSTIGCLLIVALLAVFRTN